MHTCEECGQACDCDGEDVDHAYQPDDCVHIVVEGECDVDGVDPEDDEGGSATDEPRSPIPIRSAPVRDASGRVVFE